MKRNWKWEIPHTILGRQTLCFSSYKNRKLKVKLRVGARERKKRAFFVFFILSEQIFFDNCVFNIVFRHSILNTLSEYVSVMFFISVIWKLIVDLFFFLQNHIQQCPNWYFVTKKGNVKTIVNKITKQNNLKSKVSLEMKSTIKVKLK